MEDDLGNETAEYTITDGLGFVSKRGSRPALKVNVIVWKIGGCSTYAVCANTCNEDQACELGMNHDVTGRWYDGLAFEMLASDNFDRGHLCPERISDVFRVD